MGLRQRLSIVTLSVADVVASREFYVGRLGWVPETDSDDNIVFFDLGGVRLALYGVAALAEDIGPGVSPPAPGGFNGFTLAHNVGSIEEVDEIFASLAKDGVTILKPPAKVFWGGYSGYFADPDGHPWEVAHNPFLNG